MRLEWQIRLKDREGWRDSEASRAAGLAPSLSSTHRCAANG